MAKNSEATLLLKIKSMGEEALDKVKGGLEAIGGAAKWAALAIVGAMVASVKNFSDAEDASNRLSQAIKNQGLNADLLKQQYSKLAEALQKKSTYDDDEIINGIAIAQSLAGRLRLTDELIKATVDFAAATNTDLNSAFEIVGKTIGTSTNAMVRQGLQLDENASAAEKMAKVTAFLNSRHEDMAEIMTRSTGGALKQMWNELGNLSEILGAVLAPVVIRATRTLTGFFDTAQGLANGKFALNLAQEFEAAFVRTAGAVRMASLKIQQYWNSLKLLKAVVTLDKEDAQQLGESLDKIEKEILQSSANTAEELHVIDQKYNHKRAGVTYETDKKIAAEKIKYHALVEKRSDEKLKEETKKTRDAAKKAVEEFEDFEWEKVKASEAARKKYIEEWRAGMNRAGDYASTAISGGIEKTTGKILEKVAGDLIPGFGQAAGQMFSLLSQDTDKFLETINTLFNTKFLDNISANIPILVQRFADAMPEIIDKFNEKIPEIVETIIEALIENSPRMATAMGETFSQPAFYERLVLAIANGFASGVRDGWQQAAGMLRESSFIADIMQDKLTVGMVRALENVRENIFQAFHWKIFDSIDAALNKLRDKIGSIFTIKIPGTSGGGGGGGIVGTVVSAGKSVLGMAHGGTVQPIYAADGVSVPWRSRGTDTVPAMLTPGEFVVNAGAANRNRATLEAMNNGGAMGGNSITINVYGGLLGDQRSATEFAKSIDKELLKLRQTNQSVAFDKGTF